jgi:hypothetical protein
MDKINLEELKTKWQSLLSRLEVQFGVEPDLQAVLFLIGIQELGQGSRKFTKDEKQYLMHIATCKVLSYWDYYELKGSDNEGWPDWQLKQKLPSLTLKEQDLLLRQSILRYFEDSGVFY